ncbi:MAG: sigma-70 family RNA polymerase sigma factor, partial [Rhodothermales bacterium]|nr:sigma-70 family RNA polymerase sigma factor [Rhodothermales bacterium]
LWIRRESIRIRSSVRSYLYTAARNRAINVLKRDARRIPTDWSRPGRTDVFPVERPEFVATAQDPDSSGRELEKMLGTWISELPPRRAEAFLLSRYHDLSHADIARVMGLSERTVNTHVADALRDLRRKLEKSESGYPS